jgi:hypothetical protein
MKLFESRAKKRLSPGKLIVPKDGSQQVEKLENIPREALWRTDMILAVIIRDYLRAFIGESPCVGNCVIRDNTEGKSYFETLMEISENAEAEKEYAGRWEKLVNKTADEFDDLINEMKQSYTDRTITIEKLNESAAKAFGDLAYIFNDLCW